VAFFDGRIPIGQRSVDQFRRNVVATGPALLDGNVLATSTFDHDPRGNTIPLPPRTRWEDTAARPDAARQHHSNAIPAGTTISQGPWRHAFRRHGTGTVTLGDTNTVPTISPWLIAQRTCPIRPSSPPRATGTPRWAPTPSGPPTVFSGPLSSTPGHADDATGDSHHVFGKLSGPVGTITIIRVPRDVR